MPPPVTEVDQVPLCVDLDGTLLKTDLLWESFVRLLKRNPLWLFVTLIWFLRGRAYLKRQIAVRVELDPKRLPYNEPFVAFLREARKSGRRLILATGSDELLASTVAEHLGLFDEVLASDGQTNLSGAKKCQALTERFGAQGFDYAGNSTADIAIWECAREAIVVNAGRTLSERAARLARAGPSFPATAATFAALRRGLRPHQWVKNLIVFIPVLAAHELGNVPIMLRAFCAFIASCLCASGVYIINDLMDLDADRSHATKRHRPLAAGELPLQVGLLLGPVFLLAGLCAAALLSWRLAGVLLLYIALTTSYSWKVRQIALLDVFFLAALYTVRIIAGHVVTGIAYSVWLLVFSMFIFLSLALVKRFVELTGLREHDASASGTRGYMASDLELVASLGAGSGYLAVLVLALYVNSREVTILYSRPLLLLLICPLFLYWISRMWLTAHRGEMHEDPVLHAIKDPVSYVVGLLMLLVMWAASG